MKCRILSLNCLPVEYLWSHFHCNIRISTDAFSPRTLLSSHKPVSLLALPIVVPKNDASSSHSYTWTHCMGGSAYKRRRWPLALDHIYFQAKIPDKRYDLLSYIGVYVGSLTQLTRVQPTNGIFYSICWYNSLSMTDSPAKTTNHNATGTWGNWQHHVVVFPCSCIGSILHSASLFYPEALNPEKKSQKNAVLWFVYPQREKIT